MKKLFLFILVFLLVGGMAIANPHITVTGTPVNNTAEGSSLTAFFETPDLIDLENTTGNVIYRLGTAKVGRIPICQDDGEYGSMSSCWTTTTNIDVSSEEVFRGSGSILGDYNGGDVALKYDPSAQVFLDVELFSAQRWFANANQNSPYLDIVDENPYVANWFRIRRISTSGFWQEYRSGTAAYDDLDTPVIPNNGSQAGNKWDFFELSSHSDGFIFTLGKNWTVRDNVTQSFSGSSYADYFNVGGNTNAYFFFDNIKIYNTTPNLNSSASIIAFETVNFENTFNRVNFTYYGKDVNLLFSCSDAQPTIEVTANNTYGNCVSSSTQLTAWLNLTSEDANVSFVNITTFYAAVEVGEPNIVVAYPTNKSTIANTTQYPLLIYGNVTIDSGTIANITINSSNWINTGNATAFNFTYYGTIKEGLWVLNLTANTTTGTTGSSILQFTIDLTEPVLTSSLSTNDTLYYAYDNITFQINATDNEKVYSLNVSTPEGYAFEVTGVNVTKYIYNGSINVSTYGLGKHTLTTESCDAHTSNRIPNWDETIDSDEKKVNYDFDGRYLEIYPKDASLVQDVTTEKQQDRYTFTYTKNTKNRKEDFVFVVSSSEYIDIIGNEGKYSGWLVIPKLKKWIDFNTEGREKMEYIIRRISDNEVEVEIRGIKEDVFAFNSVGTLNCVAKTYAYYLYNYTLGYETVVIAENPTTIDLVIDFVGVALSGTATLNYADEQYAVTQTTTSTTQINHTINVTSEFFNEIDKNINISFDYTLNGSSYTTYNVTQKIRSIFLVLYGNYTNTSVLNFTLRDEEDTSLNISGSIQGTFTYQTNRTFSITLSNSTNLSVCIYPPSATSSGEFVVQYSAYGYPERRYSETSAIYTNNTLVIPLYLLSSSSGAYATFVIIDGYNNPLENVEGSASKVIDGVSKVVEQQTSDASGIMTFFVNPDDDYTFTFTKAGYVTYTITIKPITSEIYTVILEEESTGVTYPYSTGVSYYFTPSNAVLNNDTRYNFTFNMTSDYWDVTSCTFNIKNSSGHNISIGTPTYNIRGCHARIEFTTENLTTLISEATFELNGTITEIVSTQYTVKYTYKGEFSFMNFIDDLRAFSDAGFNDFTRMIIAFIVIFGITYAASSSITAFRDAESLIILVWALVLFFSYIGFLTLNYNAIPEIRGLSEGWLKQYIIFIIFSLGAGSYLISRHR